MIQRLDGEEISAFTADSRPFDIAFVGSGLSAAFTTIRLVEGLLAAPPTRPVRILHVDPAGEFFTGIAYGRRSGTASLIITPLDEFLPASEMPDFLAWLSQHAEPLLRESAEYNGTRTEEWLARAERAVRDGQCTDFHIPRFFFGRYLTDRVTGLIDQGLAEGVLEGVTLISAEATALARRSSTGYTLSLARPGYADEWIVSADHVVVAIGMPPTRELFGTAATSSQALLIDNPYDPGLDRTLDRIAEQLARVGGPPGILVVGANAGCLELLYALTNVRAIESTGATVHVLSPQGQLPERYHAVARPRFDPVNLESLTLQPSVTSQAILDAAKSDVAAARDAGVAVSHSLPMVSRAVGALLSRLEATELRTFAAFAGVEIGRLQRRAGDEYCDAADALSEEGRLTIVAGKFHALEPATDGVVAWYTDPASETATAFDRPMHVVVNCSGPSAIRSPSSSRFIESLLATGILEATSAGGGLAVGNEMESTDGLYVNGPLLSGNIVADRPVWHVEHCGRIIQFSTLLAGHLLAKLADEFKDRSRV